jgi:hypothetical protein
MRKKQSKSKKKDSQSDTIKLMSVSELLKSTSIGRFRGDKQWQINTR